MTIAGVTPRAVVEPQTVEELADCVGALYAADSAFAFAGGETELELGNRPRSLDTLVKTTACNRVIDYAPQDQTITVEAGMTIDQEVAVRGVLILANARFDQRGFGQPWESVAKNRAGPGNGGA